MPENVLNSFLRSNSILRAMLGNGSYFIMIPILQNERLRFDRFQHGYLTKITSGGGGICTPELTHLASMTLETESRI